MARLNTRSTSHAKTHEGASAISFSPLKELERTVMCCLLWENGFYENGEDIATRIANLIPKIEPSKVKEVAIRAREKMNLRHIPLLIVREMARLPIHKRLVADTLEQVIQRPDELSEFVALYWKDKKQPLSAQAKKGLARAFQKFNEYQIAKYNRNSNVKLRDVLFLCHAKPKDAEQEALWKKLAEDELTIPDTWEVALSSGADQKETWERLIREKKLGAMAYLRNLRNMEQAQVGRDLVRKGLSEIKTERLLPFRFISAVTHAPWLEPELEKLMIGGLKENQKMEGRTCLLLDVSGSMSQAVSSKSEITRVGAASALGILFREIAETDVFTFSDRLVEVAPRRGFALREAIIGSQPHSCTRLGEAIENIRKMNRNYDRIVVLTDEQSHDSVGTPPAKKGYMVNVASHENGVGFGPWNRVDGWSEQIVRYIQELES